MRRKSNLAGTAAPGFLSAPSLSQEVGGPALAPVTGTGSPLTQQARGSPRSKPSGKFHLVEEKFPLLFPAPFYSLKEYVADIRDCPWGVASATPTSCWAPPPLPGSLHLLWEMLLSCFYPLGGKFSEISRQYSV